MANSTKVRHQSLVSYVVNGTTLLNTIILLMHIGFGLFFHANNMTFLLRFNYVSIALYVIGYVLIFKNIATPYSIISNLEVYIFMLLAVYYLGWNYGFQQYCIIFIVSALFTDFYVNQQHYIKKSTIISLVLSVTTYISLRIYTFNTIPVYVLDDKLPEHVLFIFNSMIAFSFLIAYSYIYSQTVFRLEKSLVEAATKDALTGLYNRRKMQEHLNSISDSLTSSGHQICIAIMDIDNFKRINDTYGHDAGDAVLKALAGILLSKQTEDFIAGRWGGEEFLIFYRTRNQNDSATFQEFDNLRQQIADTIVTCSDHQIQFTATIGLAFYNDTDSITDLIKLADKHLYYGKEHGKNIVIRK